MYSYVGKWQNSADLTSLLACLFRKKGNRGKREENQVIVNESRNKYSRNKNERTNELVKVKVKRKKERKT